MSDDPISNPGDNPLVTRITSRLAAMGLSPSRASLQAGLDRSFLRKFIHDQRAGSTRQPRQASMLRLAGVLQCNADWLLTGRGRADDPPVADAPGLTGGMHDGPDGDDIMPGVFVPGPAGPAGAGPDMPPVIPISWPEDLPVQATVPPMGAGDGAGDDAGGVTFGLHLPGAGLPPVDFVRRPPGLARARDAYALYVQGDEMAPRFRAGEMVCASPSRPPRPGDDIVVVLNRPVTGPAMVQLAATGGTHRVQDQDAPRAVLLAELVDRDAGGLRLRQHGGAEFPLAADRIQALHRIYTMAELVGM